ncbi:MAG: PEP-CTERM sorting domain-containing protein [Cyanobacteria bacterium J06648_11]
MAATLAAQPATAAIVGATGDIAIAPQPTSVNYPEGANIFGFVEAEDLAFPTGVSLTSGTIPVGRKVDSYLFHFDPVGSGTATATVTFAQPILGFIWQTNQLDASDSVFNAFLPVGNWRGLDANDFEDADVTSLVVGRESLTLDLQAGGAGIDNVRVLVATPEPATTAGLAALSSLGLAMMAKRQRQQSADARNHAK